MWTRTRVRLGKESNQFNTCSQRGRTCCKNLARVHIGLVHVQLYILYVYIDYVWPNVTVSAINSTCTYIPLGLFLFKFCFFTWILSMGGTSKVKGRRRSKRGSTRGERKGLKELAKETKKPGQSKEGRRKSSDKGQETGDGQSKYSVQQLLAQATDCMDTFNFDLAQKFLQRALEIEPDNLQLLIYCMGRAIVLSPESGYSKYMYMGQLFEGEEAVQYFVKGIELMEKEREKQDKQPEAACAEEDSQTDPVTDGDIARAYCSMAEIYLTDSCFAEDAEEKCKECIDKAIDTDSDSAEAYQVLASYWLSKEDKEQAKKSIEKSLSLWLPKMKALEEEEVNMEGSNFDPVNPCPLNYQNRIGTAKILMELEMNEQAEEILEGLLQEDDQVVQVWYMLGLINVEKTGEDHKAPARFFLNMAKKLYQKIKCDDEQVLLHTEELLALLGPGEGLDESWLRHRGESSESDDTEEDVLSTDDEKEQTGETVTDGEKKGIGEKEEKMEH
ncbi:probable assembly chaperone of rpl4 isoform X2 [Acanthaster planci]|uniref:Probable assembly chaperone of rpl4 isoform X2 n=1 Tax=Acanthaster planci TaxID=133434 RepID=A0A8B7XJ98_ACAPL|nr:probable assembly chaperone of rpl4 isoform X2 [Acanthaster planci]